MYVAPALHRRVACAAAGRAQREDRERRRVHEPGERPVPLLLARELPDEVAAPEPPGGQAGGVQGEDRPRALAEVAAQLRRVRGHVVDHAVGALRDVARVPPRRREPERGPARVHLGRAGARRGPEAAVGVLDALEVADRGLRDGGVGARRLGGDDEREQRDDERRGRRVPRDLEARPEALQRAHERRPEGEAEQQAAERVRDVERERARDVEPQLRERVVARERDPQRQVLDGAVDEARARAGERQRDAPELTAPRRARARRRSARRSPSRPSATASTGPARRTGSRRAPRPRRP